MARAGGRGACLEGRVRTGPEPYGLLGKDSLGWGMGFDRLGLSRVAPGSQDRARTTASGPPAQEAQLEGSSKGFYENTGNVQKTKLNETKTPKK